MEQPYDITPDQVESAFTIKRITDFAEDDYCYLIVDMPDGTERSIIYNYPPEEGEAIRQLELPRQAGFFRCLQFL